MVAIEKMGLLKMDFLGLTTLTILDDTQKFDRAEGRESEIGRHSAGRQ